MCVPIVKCLQDTFSASRETAGIMRAAARGEKCTNGKGAIERKKERERVREREMRIETRRARVVIYIITSDRENVQ